MLIELLKPQKIKGIRHKQGARVGVSRWVAKAMVSSGRAILCDSTKRPAVLGKSRKSAAPEHRMTMAQLYAMEAGGEWIAARKIMRSRFGITANSWDGLIEKAKRVLAAE